MVLLARPAFAQPSPALSVSRGPGADDCPDAEGLSARIAFIRGAAAPADEDGYRVSFMRSTEGLRAEIASAESSAPRVLNDAASNCAALAQATSVTLALLFDADAQSRAPAPAVPAALAPAAPARTDPESAPAAPKAPSASEPSTLGARVGAAAGVLGGVTAALSPLISLELELHGTRWRAIAGASFAPGVTHALAPGRVQQALFAASLHACFAPWSNGALQLDLCASGMVGRVHARAQGFDESTDAARAWPAFGLELRLGRAPSALGLELSAALLVPLLRQDFAIDNVGIAYESTPVALMLALRGALGWSF